MTVHLSLEDLLSIAGSAVGGKPVVRDAGLLEAAAARPRTTVFGEDAYPTVYEGSRLHSADRHRLRLLHSFDHHPGLAGGRSAAHDDDRRHAAPRGWLGFPRA